MIRKEVRALLPAWAACAVAILASRWQVEPFRMFDLGIPVYFMAIGGLGAWTMGHEYTDGTLTTLLTLPIPRRRIWSIKLLVLGAMLAALAGLAMFSVSVDRGDQSFGAALFVLPPLVALCLAPWLTIATRSPLAAAVFTFGALGGSLAAGEWLGVLRYGFTTEVDAFRVTFLWWALSSLSIVSGLLGWRGFAALEAFEGHAADVQLAFRTRRPVAAHAAPRRHYLLRLIAKELRLQQLSIAVALVCAAGYAVIALGARKSVSGSDVITILTLFYTLVLPAVVGSLACAEERQFGTLDVQLLLPVRSSTQWVIKAATALALAVILAVLLPDAMEAIFNGGARRPGGLFPFEMTVVLSFTAVSLYVSTLSRSGLRALMASIGTIAALGFLALNAFDRTVGHMVFRAVYNASPAHVHHGLVIIGDAYRFLPFCAMVVLVLVLALPNYRYGTNRRLAAAHATIVVACIMTYDVMMNVLMALKF